MQKKFYLIGLALLIIFVVFIYRTVDLSIIKHDYYLQKLNSLKEVYITGSSAPRGRILDINGKVLVDNIGVNTIVYHKESLTFLEEVEVAKSLVALTNYEYKYNEDNLKDFYCKLYTDNCNELITEEEYSLYRNKELTSANLLELKLSRVTEEMLQELSEEEKYSTYFYYRMNEGYSYSSKVLLKGVTDELYANIIEANLTGIYGEITWERTYPYNNTLKSILGTISTTLPKEKLELLESGYTLDDRVGISGIEEEYEEYLRGEKAVYQVIDNNLVLVSPAKVGNDVTLEIDIDLQLEVESIMKEQMKKAKNEDNTEYYNSSYVLISDPNSGAMRVIAGLRYQSDNTFQDISINIIKSSYTVGSVVKGASISVGYQNNLIDINTTLLDTCIKLANLPAKCSYKNLGLLNDIKALALSSNVYQFRVALSLTGEEYTYNKNISVTEDNFNTYRNTFKEYGLGTLTNIDLPGEITGLSGSIIAPDLLLNLAIGQYDLYTPAQIIQYINTLASFGERKKLNIMHNIKDGEKIIKENTTEVLNKVNLSDKYINRIREGLRETINSGTGYWYTSHEISAAGKTGTSESYIDTNYDGVVDTIAISNTFAMFAPFDNPEYSIVVLSPNTSYVNDISKYRSPVNRLIARKINDLIM